MVRPSLYKSIFCISFCLILLLQSFNTYARPSVAFVNPATADNPFWNSVTLFMQAAANDLKIDLNVVYGNDDRFDSFQLAKQALTQEYPPDYLLFVYQASTGKRILDIAEFENVNTYIFNTDIHPRDKGVVGKPREYYAYWLGHMHPDDYDAGKSLAKTLVAKAKKNSQTKRPIEILAISGGLDSTPAGLRNQGLDEIVSNDDDLKINHIVHTDWNAQQAYKKTKGLLKRYPNTSLIWGASDGLAIGAAQAFTPESEYIAGGIDWTNGGLAAVKDGRLHASVGGHFMEGGWSLVMLYDHFRGLDFNKQEYESLTKMQVIDADNIDSYLEKIQSSNYENIDFKQFSKALNPKLKHYNFSLDAVLNSLEASNKAK